MSLRAVIVDDEDLARAVVREFLAAHPDIDVAAECNNGYEAVKVISEIKPDLLFLDIQMPKLDGFEVLELIDANPAIVFVTAYDQYALRAFDAHAVDYLLKPYNAERFNTALEKARRYREPGQPAASDLAAAARPPGRPLHRIVVKDGVRVHIIPIDKLDYVEAQDDYVQLASAGKKYLKQQTISSVERGLDPERFIRVHRSYIVNLERVARIEAYAKDSRILILQDGTQVPVSRSGHSRLKDILESP